jgi:thioredoxin reductase (NADPH)
VKADAMSSVGHDAGMTDDSTTGPVVGFYDIVVVGGGAAGMSAAKIAARSRRSVLVVDAGSPRNAPAEGVHNYLYAEGKTPTELAAIGRAEAAGYGVEIAAGVATSAGVTPTPAPGDARFTVTIDGRRRVAARRLLLATGLVDELPEIPGLRERWGKDVLHCPFCHGWEVRDQSIGVLSTGPMAAYQTLLFRALSEDVVVFTHTGPAPTDEQREQFAALGVRVVDGEVAAVQTADGRLSAVVMANGRVIERQAVVVTTGSSARTDLIDDLGLDMSDLEVAGQVLGRYLSVDPTGATTTAGVWAAGNLTSPALQVIDSAAGGAAAGAAMHRNLLDEDTAIAVAAHRRRAAVRS